MKNQDTPANPVSPNKHDHQWAAARDGGETKYEKAFWQVYSAIMSDPKLADADAPDMAEFAINAVNAGFEALENRND